jgi:hypothetical protein
MSYHLVRSEQRVAATPQVWCGLSSDRQQRAVRLLAQLAYAQVRTHAQLSTQENPHVHAPQQRQDPPRSS